VLYNDIKLAEVGRVNCFLKFFEKVVFSGKALRFLDNACENCYGLKELILLIVVIIFRCLFLHIIRIKNNTKILRPYYLYVAPKFPHRKITFYKNCKQKISPCACLDFKLVLLLLNYFK
jgi:hypothetical protein